MTSEKVESALRAAGLGFLIWWSLRDVDIPRADLRAAFDSRGLGKAVPRDPRPSALLSRACREALVGKGGEWQFDRVRDDEDVAVAALSRRSTDDLAEMVSYVQVGLVRVMKKTGDVLPESSSIGTPEADIISDVAMRFRHVRDNASTEDLRASLTHAMRGRRRDLLLGAVEVNGVFFVRAEQRDAVHGLRDWVKERGFGDLSVLQIADDGVSRAQLIEGTQRTIESRVREVLAESEQLAERIKAADEEDVDRILAPYLERFELAEAAADLYADVLGNMATGLRESIAKARSEFSKRIV